MITLFRPVFDSLQNKKFVSLCLEGQNIKKRIEFIIELNKKDFNYFK